MNSRPPPPLLDARRALSRARGFFFWGGGGAGSDETTQGAGSLHQSGTGPRGRVGVRADPLGRVLLVLCVGRHDVPHHTESERTRRRRKRRKRSETRERLSLCVSTQFHESTHRHLIVRAPETVKSLRFDDPDAASSRSASASRKGASSATGACTQSDSPSAILTTAA